MGKSEPVQSEIETQRQTVASHPAAGQEKQRKQAKANNAGGRADAVSGLTELQHHLPGRMLPKSHQVSAKAFEQYAQGFVLEPGDDTANVQSRGNELNADRCEQ